MFMHLHSTGLTQPPVERASVRVERERERQRERERREERGETERQTERERETGPVPPHLLL